MKFTLATAAAAVLLSATASQAADLAKKAPVAVDYVKVCDAYGAGFFYIPGSETCLKIGGYVRTQVWGGDGDASSGFTNFNDSRGANSFNTLGRLDLQFDARSQTDFGVLRSYGQVNIDAQSNRTGTNWDVEGYRNLVDKAFIQWAGFTVGYATSSWDFFTGYTLQLEYGSAEHDDSRNLAAYTFQFGNGLTATISAEDPTYNSRTPGISTGADLWRHYGAVKAPEIIGNVRIDQAWGSAQVMGVAHHIYGDNDSGVWSADKWGYAVGAGVQLKLPFLGAGDLLALQVVYADGANQYTGGVANDFDSIGDTNATWSIEGGFKHIFSPAWALNLDAAYVATDFSNSLSTNDITSAIDSRFDASVALVWTPATNLAITGTVEYRDINYTSASVLEDGSSWVAGVRVQRNF